MPCCPCITCLAALKVIYLIMRENDSFLISLLNAQPGSNAVSSTSQRVLLQLFFSGADKLQWLLLRSSVAVLYFLPVEQHIDKVIQQSGEHSEHSASLLCLHFTKRLLSDASAQHSQNSAMQGKGQAPILKHISSWKSRHSRSRK